MLRSTEELAQSVEMLLFAATGYVTSLEGGPAQLMAAACDIFDGDGCILSRESVRDPGLEQHLLVHLRAGQYPSARMQQILSRPVNGQNSVLLINLESEGGPAILTIAANGKMLLYRHNHLKPFNDQDAQLVSALWRSCGITGESGPSASMATRIEEQRFSPRLRQVLQGMLRGLAEKQIASHLGISGHTVHVYVKSLYRQIGVRSRSELILHFFNQPAESSESAPSVLRNGREPENPKVEDRKIEPPDEVITAASPVTSIGGTGTNVSLRNSKANGQKAYATFLPS